MAGQFMFDKWDVPDDDYTNIEFGTIDRPKVKRKAIRTVKVVDGFVAFYRGSDYAYKEYQPRGEWLDRLCEILTGIVNDGFGRAEITLFSNGYEVDLAVDEDESEE